MINVNEDDNAIEVLDVDDGNSKKWFVPLKNVVDYLAQGYSKASLCIGDPVLALYPVGGNPANMTTLFYEGRVSKLNSVSKEDANASGDNNNIVTIVIESLL